MSDPASSHKPISGCLEVSHSRPRDKFENRKEVIGNKVRQLELANATAMGFQVQIANWSKWFWIDRLTERAVVKALRGWNVELVLTTIS